ncbi:MAG: TIM barrel protein [Armatimonadetes bacterium]|nr:TIM barrel protein [Armatimonadota bacterium]
MKFGCCASLARLKAAAGAGFDYIETEAVELRPRLCDADFKPLLRLVESAPVRPEVFHSFIPDRLPLVGEDIDFQRVRRYTQAILERAAHAGGQVVVFDSLQPRADSETMPPERIYNQVTGFLRMAAGYARKYNVVVAVKPLYAGHAYLLDTLADVTETIEDVGCPEIRLAADISRIGSPGSVAISKQVMEHLAHVYLTWPENNDIAPAQWLEPLRDSGYGGRVSLLGRWQDFPEQASACLRSCTPFGYRRTG